MTDRAPDNIWPLPTFYFSVQLGDEHVRFQEATGLWAGTDPVEYRHGDHKNFAPAKMAGRATGGSVTLKKGTFAKDASFFAWISDSKVNPIPRRKVVIHLLDKEGARNMTWTLDNAWPKKTMGMLGSSGNEVGVESVEIAYEALTLSVS